MNDWETIGEEDEWIRPTSLPSMSASEPAKARSVSFGIVAVTSAS